jgi:hypothetical protein
MIDHGGELLVDAFVERAQCDLAMINEQLLDDGWDRLQESGAGHPQPQKRPFWRGLRLALAATLAAAVLVIIAYRFVPTGRGTPLQYSVEGTVAGTEGSITAGPDTKSWLRFSDDSCIQLSALARLSVDGVEERGARITLIDGSIDVFVKPRSHAAWTFAAGPFRVKVKGTSFRLGYSAEQQRMSLHMATGLVEVVGSRGRAIAVSGGEAIELFADPTLAAAADVGSAAVEAPLVDERPAPVPAMQEKSPVHGLRGGPAPEAPNRRAAMHVEPTAELPHLGWSQLLKQGRFADVIADAEERGLDTTLAQASAADLSVLADAARYTKHHDLARQVLLTIRSRFAGNEPGRDAAFFLGRLGESAPGQSEAALGWYETYLQEAPRGLYASEALAREMTLLAGKDRGRATKLARQYLDRFPRGAQAELARSLLETGND